MSQNQMNIELSDAPEHEIKAKIKVNEGTVRFRIPLVFEYIKTGPLTKFRLFGFVIYKKIGAKSTTVTISNLTASIDATIERLNKLKQLQQETETQSVAELSHIGESHNSAEIRKRA